MSTRANRGPGAAAANRAALLASAREVLGERGARAPQSAKAQNPGVIQAGRNPHFPTRESHPFA
ncbi:MAG: TetR/AcrR family transcriptional regulator, partial [Actinomycetes bacterium]|nr:TetR/AcrR family transcriptional regulator [Actinomycetes bacterium]